MYSQADPCLSSIFTATPTMISIAWDSPPIPGTTYSGEFQYSSSIPACASAPMIGGVNTARSGTSFIEVGAWGGGHAYFKVPQNTTADPRGGYVYAGAENAGRASVFISQAGKPAQTISVAVSPTSIAFTTAAQTSRTVSVTGTGVAASFTASASGGSWLSR